MIVWMARVGWLSVVLGVLLWTPLADFLPIELWVQLQRFLPGTSVPTEHTYLRVVPAPEGSVDPITVVGAALMVLGLLLVATGRLMRSRP